MSATLTDHPYFYAAVTADNSAVEAVIKDIDEEKNLAVKQSGKLCWILGKQMDNDTKQRLTAALKAAKIAIVS